MHFRNALTIDAAAIAAIHVNAWRIAYSDIIPKSYLDTISLGKRKEMWESILSESTKGTFVLSDDHGSITGWASFGASRDDDGDGTGEIYGIYIDPAWWGNGFGKKLMGISENELESRGFGSVTLWVLEKNNRARRFYETVAYKTDGALKTVEMADVKLVEIRYRKSLDLQ